MLQHVKYMNSTTVPQRTCCLRTAQWTSSERTDSGRKHPKPPHFSSSLGSICSRNALAWQNRETQSPFSPLLGSVTRSQKISPCLKAQLYLLYT